MEKFEEVQRFRQKWLWSILITAIGASVYLSFIQEGISSMVFVLLISLPVLLLIYGAKLETLIEDGRLSYRFFPFHLKYREVNLEEADLAVESYSPIREFGGWGLRWRPGKLAFSVSGKNCIRIERENSRELVIGTQKLEEAEGTLKKL